MQFKFLTVCAFALTSLTSASAFQLKADGLLEGLRLFKAVSDTAISVADKVLQDAEGKYELSDIIGFNLALIIGLYSDVIDFISGIEIDLTPEQKTVVCNIRVIQLVEEKQQLLREIFSNPDVRDIGKRVLDIFLRVVDEEDLETVGGYLADFFAYCDNPEFDLQDLLNFIYGDCDETSEETPEDGAVGSN